jgi:type VI secretion system protein ImpK
MQEQIANLVYPVISYALRLKDRLERREEPDLDTEQASLKGLLLTDMEARRLVDFGGEASDNRSISMTRMGGDLGRRSADAFLGIRYALVCWLDEIFIVDSPWARQWNEQKLETALYGTNIRAELFWEQARRAESRPGSDALEVFFLCVMLGFRGELREDPDRLMAWVSTTQARISKGLGTELPMPPEHEAPSDVPPRHAREKLQRVFLIGSICLLILIPIVAALLAQKLLS